MQQALDKLVENGAGSTTVVLVAHRYAVGVTSSLLELSVRTHDQNVHRQTRVCAVDCAA